MTSRLLPRAEWPRLAGTELEPIWPHLDPTRAEVLVIEDEAGAIVGCWSQIWVLHGEGLWIAPSERKRARVAKYLWAAFQDRAAEQGVPAVQTAADSDEVRALLEGRGTKIPADGYVLPIPHDVGTLGRTFHVELEAAFGEPAHADDPAHNRAVGLALKHGVLDDQPERAVADYNTWALIAGYEPIRSWAWDGDRPGYVVDMGSAVIALDAACHLTLLEDRRAMPVGG